MKVYYTSTVKVDFQFYKKIYWNPNENSRFSIMDFSKRLFVRFVLHSVCKKNPPSDSRILRVTSPFREKLDFTYPLMEWHGWPNRILATEWPRFHPLTTNSCICGSLMRITLFHPLEDGQHELVDNKIAELQITREARVDCQRSGQSASLHVWNLLHAVRVPGQ